MEPTRDCNGNPINYTDPSGHNPEVIRQGIEYLPRALEGLKWIGGAIAAWWAGTELSKKVNVKNDVIVAPAPNKLTLSEKANMAEINKIIKEALKIKAKTERSKNKFFEMKLSRLPKSTRKIAVIGKPLTEPQAVKRLKSKKDTVTWFGFDAKRIALTAGNGRKVMDHTSKKDTHLKDYIIFRHYHPNNHKNPAHSSFLFG